MIQLLITANVPSLPILVTLMMGALGSSETSVVTRATRRNIPEDAILQMEVRLVLPDNQSQAAQSYEVFTPGTLSISNPLQWMLINSNIS
jgi:hypothetical protein